LGRETRTNPSASKKRGIGSFPKRLFEREVQKQEAAKVYDHPEDIGNKKKKAK
jgi:hypothetical protein